mgnify:CR=1 FL=1
MSTWPARSFVDPEIRISERDLDALKHRATITMARARDHFIAKATGVAHGAYSEAHQYLLRCRTEAEVETIERGFNRAMLNLKGVVDAAG